MAEAAPTSERRHPTTGAWWAPWVIIAAIVAVYVRSLGVPFVFDDVGAVVNNPTIRRLDSMAVLSPPADGSTTTGRPLVNLSYAFNYAISGDQPGSYHAVNLALHAGAALLLLGIVRRTLRLGFSATFTPAQADAVGFGSALVWAVHPLLSETVVTIAQRTESLCVFLYLLTVYTFIRSVGGNPISDSRARRTATAWAAVSVGACALGMSAKEVMVTAPVLVLLYDRTFVSGSFRAAWSRRAGYYWALVATWLLLAVLVIGGHAARGASAGFGLGISAWDYLLQQAVALCLYLKLAIWPHPLVLDYGTGVAGAAAAAVPFLLVTALVVATIWGLSRHPRSAFCAAAFFLILAPSSSVVPLVTQTMAEHRMYLPLAVIVTPLVAFTALALRRASWLALVIVVALGVTTAMRVALYRDPLRLWQDNVANYPSSARGHENLACLLQQAGQSAAADAEFARAVALDPRYVTAHYSWGVALLERGEVARAVAELATAVQLAPDHADAQLNLGNALFQAGRPADSLPHFEAALRLTPAADAHYDYGLALVTLGRSTEAAAHFRSAVELESTLADPHFQLGRLAERAGDATQAQEEYATALRLAPNHVAAHARLGLLLAQANQLEPAAEHLATAVRLRPDDADVRANLGNVLLLQGKPREAIACYEEVLRQRPNDARARENLQLAREALR